MNIFQILTTNPLLLSAMIACLGSSLVSGIIGSYVVVKRIAFISGSISHSVLSGMGFCLWLQKTQGISWATPTLGALLAAITSALIIGWVRIHYRQREDSVIAAIWSTGMAIGVIFTSLTPGYNAELVHFLVGNVLWISPSDLQLLLGLDLVVLLSVLYFHKKFLAICFDEEQARLQGIPVNTYYLLLLTLIAISVVLLIQMVGILLVLTILTLPAAIANLFTHRLSRLMVRAVILSTILCLTGLGLSYHFDLPPGATIALLAGITYIVALAIQKSREGSQIGKT